MAFHFFFFFNDTATTEIYTLSLHDALPISRRRRWASRPGTSRSPANAASGYPASRPAISPGRSPAPARGSRLTRPQAAGFCIGPPQTERSCTRESWMSGARAWWSASGYSRSRAADLCGRRIHEKPDNVKRERCTTASREDVAHGSARRLRATSLLDDVLCYAIARCLLARSARGLRSRPWSRGADPRHSDRDRLRAGLPRLHDPDDLRSGAGGWLSGAVRSEEHTSELQSLAYLVCRLLLEKKKKE